jgi:hypothetical protein
VQSKSSPRGTGNCSRPRTETCLSVRECPLSLEGLLDYVGAASGPR